jgi:hypothetical protein
MCVKSQTAYERLPLVSVGPAPVNPNGAIQRDVHGRYVSRRER